MNLELAECICPIYIEEKGDCTIIIERKRIKIINRSISNILEYIIDRKKKIEEKEKKVPEFDRYLVRVEYTSELDRKLYEKKIEEGIYESYTKLFVAKKNILPLIYKGKVFIKVKIRKPRITNDSSYGYINLDMIDKIDCRNDITWIIFTSGNKIKVNSSFNTFYSNLMIGRLMMYIANNLYENNVDKSDECIFRKINKWGIEDRYINKKEDIGLNNGHEDKIVNVEEYLINEMINC